MLKPYDLVCIKRAQRNDSFLSFARQAPLPTLADLVQAVRADSGITAFEEQRVLDQIRAIVGSASGSTPLSALMYKGLGGTLGYLISKYFGMSTMGQLLSAAAGFGIGKVLHDKLNAKPDPYRGYKLL